MTNGSWEKRWHPLLEQWVIIAASSGARPWSGAMANATRHSTLAHDPECYLCPRVSRASGSTNPDYHGAYAFDNDFPSLSFSAPTPSSSGDGIDRGAPAHGLCRVLCWSERHDATLASLSDADLIDVARLWQSEYVTLAKDPRIAQISIFENKGTEIGVSNLHPHGQVYATDFVTDTADRMRKSQARYADLNSGRSLMGDILDRAHRGKDLIVETTEHWTVLVPFCARFSYETWIVPNRHINSIASLSEVQLADFARVYQRQVKRYDALFQRSAPNISLFHNAPVDEHPGNALWCFHLVFQPPLRDLERMKYLAGFESGANNIVNPLQPELAAQQLRDISLSAITINDE